MFEEALGDVTAQETRDGEHDDGERHGEVFLDAVAAHEIAAGIPVECEEEHAEHVERGEAAREESEAKDDVVVPLECGEDDFVLREEAGERRNSRNREHADEATPVSEGHLAPEPAHLFEVVRVDHVDDGTCDEEQAALEEGVRKDVERGSCPACSDDDIAHAADAERKHHVA